MDHKRNLVKCYETFWQRRDIEMLTGVGYGLDINMWRFDNQVRKHLERYYVHKNPTI